MHIETPLPTAMTESILVVDDETGVRELIARWLANGGYAVSTASGADEALERIHDAPPAVALCDIRMPGHDGLWLAREIRRDAPETAVIMATGVQDVGPAVTSLRQGVIDYLTKPFGRDRLRESVLRGVEWHKAARESRRWRETLQGEVEVRRDRLRDALAALTIDSDAALDGFLSVLLLADHDAYAHAYRVAALAASVGCALQLGDDDMASLERAALMHDIGKLAMPEAVLRKPAPLTIEEQHLIRQHPQIAADLIANVPYLQKAAELVRDAHERIDGLGYPNGSHASDVALGARVIAVADAFDAMTRPRVFRDAITAREALLELDRCAGTQFDRLVVDMFKRVVQT
ncbi:MAG TPA: HD domain-containing phosphohydrolase [Vicinamibacterales bacterium]|jgi:response regulator RpfG family c-di-GMP phosphodiesterase|nr:HD domain-containing phosphohydrolase [Vicinamibacterales bacterium]